MTPPPMTRSTGLAPGCRPGSGRTRAQIDESRGSGTGRPDRPGTAPRPINAAENTELARLYDNDTVGQATRQWLQAWRDLEAAPRLSDEQTLTPAPILLILRRAPVSSAEQLACPGRRGPALGSLTGAGTPTRVGRVTARGSGRGAGPPRPGHWARATQ